MAKILKENIKKFVHETSAKGIPKIFKSEHSFSKLLWLIATSLCFIVAAILCYNLISSYLQYQTNTRWVTHYCQSNIYIFPSLNDWWSKFTKVQEISASWRNAMQLFRSSFIVFWYILVLKASANKIKILIFFYLNTPTFYVLRMTFRGPIFSWGLSTPRHPRWKS